MRFSWHLLELLAGAPGKPIPLQICAIFADGTGRSPAADGTGRSPAIVTSRKAGFSTRNYSGLNLSSKVGDEKNAVRKNKELLLSALGISEDALARPEQVHAGLVLQAAAPGVYEKADGLVLTGSAPVGAILVADCVPVFVFNDDFSVVGLAHAGREGTRAEITRNLISSASALGVSPDGLFVALGPSIGACCYELDSRTASDLPSQFLFERESKIFFDLWQANACQAIEMSIPKENIVMPPFCTCCRQDLFFSHRGQRGGAGRQMALAVRGGIDLSGKKTQTLSSS